MLNLPISDIMNDHPIKVKSDVSIRNVAHLMLRYRINGILIVTPDEKGELLGVFTTRELLHIMGEAMSGGKRMSALKEVGDKPVADFLGREEIVILQANDNAVKAVALMHKRDVITIPVFEGDKLVGVVGRHDVINIAFA